MRFFFRISLDSFGVFESFSVYSYSFLFNGSQFIYSFLRSLKNKEWGKQSEHVSFSTSLAFACIFDASTFAWAKAIASTPAFTFPCFLGDAGFAGATLRTVFLLICATNQLKQLHYSTFTRAPQHPVQPQGAFFLFVRPNMDLRTHGFVKKAWAFCV